MHYKNSARESGGAKTLKKQHPATFPDKLAEDFILAFTQEGDIVLDPFAGSGTTLWASEKNNRYSIGFEINEAYVDLAKQRLKLDFK